MKRILSSNYKYLILGIFLVLTIVSAILSFRVEVNYDMTKYLPKDSNTKQAIEILSEEFGDYASIELMVEDVEIMDAVMIKNEIKGIDGVLKVVWMDDLEEYAEFITDPLILLELKKMQESYYKDKKALFTILLDDNSYSLEVEDTINEIRETNSLKDKAFSMRGEALYNIDSRRILNGEMFKIILVIVPIILLILVFASKSWIEPLIILVNLGIAIVLNMGTNIIFKDVSYVTQSLAMVLQLAISLDYSLFLIHRYYEEKEAGHSTTDALVIASKNTFGSILGSALTTIVGFSALLFMQYTIGSDIGLVMGKGIIFSFVTTIILMPILILLFSKLLNKTMKKNYSGRNIDKVASVFYRKRYVTLIVFVVIAVVAIIFQGNTKFLYATSEATDEKSTLVTEESNIEKVFGINKPIVILVPNGDPASEAQLVQELMMNENINSVSSIVFYETLTNFPRDLFPAEIKQEFIGENYTRIIINTKIDKESEAMYEFSYELKEIISKYYEENYLAGVATSTTEIKDVVTSDKLVVTLFSIIGVGLVILLIFKSISLPLLLLMVIQSSIWINMSIVSIKGVGVIYIGFLVIQTLQLGATIDYAVLLTSRYKELRTENSSIDAISKALKASGISVIISAAVLAVAGYGEGLLSNIPAVKEIGILIGRGALISGILVILVLPSILIIFDKIIMKTTHKANFYIDEPKE
jgi:predicted RND superfamily exporter protein